MAEDSKDALVLTAEIVVGYLETNPISAEALPGLIQNVHEALVAAANPPAAAPEAAKPSAAQIRKSITPEGLISFVDGKSHKTLTRHLTKNGITPQDYRDRYGLGSDYPMVASEFSARRAELAKRIGLGARRAPTAAPPAKLGRRRQVEQTQQAQKDASTSAIDPKDETFISPA